MICQILATRHAMTVAQILKCWRRKTPTTSLSTHTIHMNKNSLKSMILTPHMKTTGTITTMNHFMKMTTGKWTLVIE